MTIERWLRPVGVVIVAAVIIDGPAEQPPPGLHGDRLGVLLALAAFAVGLSAMYLVVVLAQRAREGQRRAERLLDELEQSRAAHVRAATLSERRHLARDMHDVPAHSLSALTLHWRGPGCWPPPTRRTPDGSRPPWNAPTTWPRRGAAGDRRAPRRRAAGTTAAGRAGPGLRARQRRQLPSGGRRGATRARLPGPPGRLPHRPGGAHQRPPARPRRAGRGAPRLRARGHTPGRRGPRPGGEPAAAPDGDGYGLTGMRERAELLDGTLTAAPTDTGFRVELWVPA
jgi:hypothetical protein